jgi:hypothetical protein
LNGLRPGCLRLPEGPIPPVPRPGTLKAQPGNKYLVLKLFCPGFSTCRVKGTAVLDAIGKLSKLLGTHSAFMRAGAAKPIAVARGTFAIGDGGSPTATIPTTSAGRKILTRIGKVKVRIRISATYPGDGVQVMSRGTATLTAAS